MQHETVTALCAGGIISVVRANQGGTSLLGAIEALALGGIRCIEITMTVPDAVKCISEIVHAFPGDQLLIGVGSVTDPYDCRRAVDAGARYVVTPGFVPHVIETAKVLGVPALSGAYTPSEVLHAHSSGPDLVKIFPASVGGPELIRSLKGPLPHIRLVPTGGVTVENVAEFFQAGAEAVAAGGNLADPKLIDEGDVRTIQQRAEAFVKAVASARNS